MNLADNLKKIRKDNNLSQEQLAEKLNVSRQSVSKWESGQSYPEMDKVIQICNLFNLNINELINENISEVNEVKESQNRTNKYISSFFDYITKVVDMFSSMKFGQIIKCLFEQCIVFLILFIIEMAIGSIGSNLFYSIFNFLPDGILWRIYNIVESIFLVVLMIIGTIVFLHIFKVRYLDYYEIVKDDKKEPVEEVVTEVEAVKVKEENSKKDKIVLEKKKEKVVIRDPKHSDYRFFTGIGKFILFCIKSFVLLILVCFALSFVGFVLCLPIIFMVVGNFSLFSGLLICLLGCIAFNFVIVELLYNFVFNRKTSKGRTLLISIVSLIAIGIGVGITITSCVNFEVEDKYYEKVSDEFLLDMSDDIRIECWGYWYSVYEQNLNYVVEDRKDVRIVVKHPAIYSVETFQEDELYIIDFDDNYNEVMIQVRDVIKGINKSKIYNYLTEYDVTIYASAENISKLKNNYDEYYDELNRLSKENSELYNENNELIAENERLEHNNYALVNELNEMGYVVHYDEIDYYSYIEKEE